MELDFAVTRRVSHYNLGSQVADGYESLSLRRKSTFRVWKSRRMSKSGLRLTAAAVSAFVRRRRHSSAYAIRNRLSQSLFVGHCAHGAMKIHASYRRSI
jgi:hypothetical protein